MDEANNNYPTRPLKPIVAPDGATYWKSCTHAANIGGEIRPNLDLSGLIIFVHGVNSEGEWYEVAEKELCKRLIDYNESQLIGVWDRIIHSLRHRPNAL